MKRFRPILPLLMFALVTLAQNASACAICYGGKDGGRQADSMNAGIFSLLFIVVCVLGGIAAFFIFLVRRSAMFPTPPEFNDFNTHSTQP